MESTTTLSKYCRPDRNYNIEALKLIRSNVKMIWVNKHEQEAPHKWKCSFLQPHNLQALNLSSVKKVCIFLINFPLDIVCLTSHPLHFSWMMVSWNSSQCEPSISRGHYWHRVIKLNHKQVISAHRNGDQNLEIWTLLTTVSACMLVSTSNEHGDSERNIQKLMYFFSWML